LSCLCLSGPVCVCCHVYPIYVYMCCQDLLLYLLQLVQALKYENYEEIKSGLETTPRRDSAVIIDSPATSPDKDKER
jgi:hypothetical protein